MTVTVLVVDDSAVIRRLLVTALSREPGIEVVGTAANGRLAQGKIDQLRPDVVTMDIEMPELDGIAAVKELRKRHPRMPVIMFSTLSAAGAAATLDALSAGATDYVTKPSSLGNLAASMTAIANELVPKIKALGSRSVTPRSHQRRDVPAHREAPGRRVPTGRADVVAVGCSTGGPDALTRLLQGLPRDLPTPVLVTQHMPPVFTRMFAERLDRTTGLAVVEAADGMPIAPGTVYIAPGDFHLVLEKGASATVIRLSSAPPENSCRPAVDVMFRSVRATFGASAVAVVLTGMGYDGREGVRELRAAGARVLVQDEATSVVWGMPGAVANAGMADAVLPLDQLADAVLSGIGRTLGRSAS